MSVPLKDLLLVPYSANWVERVSSAPGDFALTAGQASALTALHAPYVAAYEEMMNAREAGIRSKSLTAARDSARLALVKYLRELYAIVQASAMVTDANKELLGVVVKDTTKTKVEAPDLPPGTDMVSVFQRAVKIHIHDKTSSAKRGKAPGAIGAYVYAFVGENYPPDPKEWEFCGAATKATFDIVFPQDTPNGSTVWICAAWYTRTGETGPVSIPISTILQGGLTMAG